MVMAPPEPFIPESAFYQPILGSSNAAIASSLQGLPIERYTLQRWASIFQVIEAQESKNSMLYPEGIRRSKEESLNPPDHTLTLDEPIPEDFLSAKGQERKIWINY